MDTAQIPNESFMSQSSTAVSTGGMLSSEALNSLDIGTSEGTSHRLKSTRPKNYPASDECPLLSESIRNLWSPDFEPGSSTTEGGDLRIPISKVRPHPPHLESSESFVERRQELPKVRPADNGTDFATPPMQCRDDSFSTMGSHAGHHHNVPHASPNEFDALRTGNERMDALNQDQLSNSKSSSDSQDLCSAPECPTDSGGTVEDHAPTPASDRSHPTSRGSNSPSKDRPSTPKASTPLSVQRRDDPTRFVHAPIPISKIRPFLDTYVRFEQGQIRSTPKVSSVADANGAISHLETRLPDTKKSHGSMSGSERLRQPSPQLPDASRSRPSSSYSRTAQWLRHVIKPASSYTPTYTKRSNRSRSANAALSQDKKDEESPLSFLFPSSTKDKLSSNTGRFAPKFDGIGLKSAVSDLERLLNEALAIASQVVEQPTPPHAERFGQRPRGSRGHNRTIMREPSLNPAARLLATPSADGSAGDVEPIQPGEETGPRRPPYQHASTSSVTPRRPRLEELVQSYSGDGKELQSKVPPIRQGCSDAPLSQNMINIPRRKSSKHMKKYYSKHGVRRPSSLHSRSTTKEPARVICVRLKDDHWDQVQNPTHSKGEQAGRGYAHHQNHHHHHNRRPVEFGDDNLPERDIAGRPLHTDHGISLRRKSHVSLRGAQGFNLAKAHKRKPIARD